MHGGLAMPACPPRAIPEMGMRSGGPRRHTEAPRACPAWLGAIKLGDSQVGHIIDIQWKGDWEGGGGAYNRMSIGDRLEGVHIVLSCFVKLCVSGVDHLWKIRNSLFPSHY